MRTMKNLFKNLSIKNLKVNINKYGYKYSTKDFLLEALVILSSVFVIAYISRLQFEYILILILITIFIIPILINALFKQNYHVKRFEMLEDYLNNIIPIFTQKTKIRYTLGELLDITSGDMKKCISKAIKYIDTTTDDQKLFRNALGIIEKEFPNSRVKSVHKLLLSIESLNSIDYKDVCDNMYDDIEEWIRRVYIFQKDLKNRRTKIIILCLLTLLLNCLFVYIYVSNKTFVGFTDNIVYQVSTLVFIASVLITITIVFVKLNGEWLINDTLYKNDEELKKQYEIYKGGKKKIRVIDIILSILCLSTSIYFVINKNYKLSPVPILISVIVLSKHLRVYKGAYRKVVKALTVEFPVWLREVSLNLNNLTVLNAIAYSQNICSYPLRKEIRIFLDEAKNDPVSIKPYNKFLSDYDLEDAKSSMKVLYSLQNIGKNNIKHRVSNLIARNQRMLDKAETIKNNDSISGIETLGYIPIILFSFQMLISMYSMFTYIMGSLSRSIA